MTALPADAHPPPPGVFRHEALLYSGQQQFVDGAAAYVREALAADEPVLAALVSARASVLREELGPEADRVRFLDLESVGRNPSRIIPAWQDWVSEHAAGGRGFRGLGEPFWADRCPARTVDWQHHEQLLNTAFDEGPAWWLLCPYDTAALPSAVIEDVRRTHPAFLDGGVRHDSADYPHPELSPTALLASPLPDPGGPVRELAFDRAGLPGLRRSIAEFAVPLLGDKRTEELVLAVHEVAANSVMHGGGRGTARWWREDGELICEVRDRGQITDPLAGRRRPPGTADGGAGLWIANQVCDLVRIRSAPGVGTVVRLHVDVPRESRSDSG